jgi:putative DNA primase/helicase
MSVEAVLYKNFSQLVEEVVGSLDLTEIPSPSALAQEVISELRSRIPILTVVREDRILDTYVYQDGVYVKGEKILRSLYYEILRRLGITERVRRYSSYASDFSRMLVDSTLADVELNEHIVLYGSTAFDWRGFMYDKEPFLFPPSPENFIVHRIKWPLDIDVLRKDPSEAYSNFYNETAVSRIFESWAGDKWPLLLEIVGYCLLAGEYPFNKAVMIYGEENTGKSTFLWLLGRLLGEENVSHMPLQKLTSERDRFSAIELYHKMANIYSDIPKEGIYDTGKFKMLTGEDYISAERKFKDPISFKNYAKMIFSANELPDVHDMTGAFWRRWIVIRFENKFEQNPGYRKMLEEELLPKEAGKLLSYALLAIKNVFLNNKFSFEGTATDYREEWLRRSNSVYAFLSVGKEEGWLEEGENKKTRSSELYGLYTKWCKEEERDGLSHKAFTEEVNRLGYPSKKMGGDRFYMGIGIVYEKLPEELRRGSEEGSLV